MEPSLESEIPAVAYALRDEDYLAFHRRMRPLTLRGALTTGGRWLCVPTFLTVLVYQSPFIAGDARRAAGLWLIAALLWIGFCLWVERSASLRTYMTRVGAKRPRQVLLRADGVLLETTTTRTLYAWPAFRRMDGDPKHLYFTLGPTSAIIIPTSAFVTPHGAEQFLSAARQHAEAAHTRLSVSEASGRAADFLPEPEDGIFPNPRVRFFLSPDDVVRYYRLVGRGYLVRAIILTLVVAGGILLSITALFRVNLLDALPIIAVDFVLLVGVTAWRVDRDRRRRAALHGATEQTLILTAQGIEERMPFTVGRTPWEKIRAITETPTLFLMVFGPQHSVVIPKRAFGSAEEARVFFQNAQAFRQAALTGTDAPPVEQVASWPPPPRR